MAHHQVAYSIIQDKDTQGSCGSLTMASHKDTWCAALLQLWLCDTEDSLNTCHEVFEKKKQHTCTRVNFNDCHLHAAMNAPIQCSI